MKGIGQKQPSPGRAAIGLFFSGCLVLCTLSPGWSQMDMAGLDVETLQEFGELDRNRDGGLDPMEFLFSEVAQRVREKRDQDGVEAVHRKMDLSGDGKLDVVEFSQAQLTRNARLLDRDIARGYQEFDEDLDGVILLREYEASRAARSARERGKDPEFVRGLFKRIDLNGTKRVGPVEYVQALPDSRHHWMDAESAQVFARLDRDDNGAVDREEVASGGKLLQGLPDLTLADLNGNREIGPREFAKACQAGSVRRWPPHVQHDFERLDRNRDGALSEREFEKGPWREREGRRGDHLEEMFARLDRDRDRELSIDEFAEAKPYRRGFGPPGPQGPPGPPGGPPGPPR